MIKIRGHAAFILVGSLLALHATACGPSTYSKERIVFESLGDAKQSESGLTVERQKVVDLPPEFQARAGKCGLNGEPLLDFQGQPMTEVISLVPAGAVVEKLSIQNSTSHIIRLGGAVIAMFDPADNQYDHLDRDAIAASLAQEHPCSNPLSLKKSLTLVKMIDRNTEILPKRTQTGYIMFAPTQMSMAGDWKLSLYEVPVETAPDGRVSKTVEFDFRTAATRYRDTFVKDNLVATPRLVSTEKVGE
jgi:hypothetical protein